MATEAPLERSNEAAVTSDTEPITKIDADIRHGDFGQPQVNGDAASTATDEIENKHISDIVDDLVNSAEVSTSGGSDNEASKSDVSRLKDEEKGHGRTSSSVKKPASFKSISVNRTFLNTKTAAASTPAKPSDKVSATATLSTAQTGAANSAARPRLVAKSGSGLVSKASGLNGGKPGSAPDPNAVWNKNRPAPAPEPKKYTDEELQNSGIHMASRLHPDDAKGQANWADIDDDDEDWQPETITWQDGTKIAIPHVEDTPAPAPEPAPQPVMKESGPPEKPRSPAPGASPSIKAGVLASGKGLILKGAPEKPTLVAKPPAPPTPVKSPWATLPKIDKGSSISADLAQNQPGAKFAPRDHSISKSMTPPPKEIAADDFTRSPRRDAPRELYNSQSGRYEPVSDRRGGLRNEPAHVKPLLHRTTQPDSQGPAEPSAAFQTSRSSDQHGPYGRRRGSSNVSGGSGSYLHRLKAHDQTLPPPDIINARRESMTAGSDSPASPRNFSPSGQQAGPRNPINQQWAPGVSPGSVHSTPYQANPPGEQRAATAQPTADPSRPITEQDYEVQKKLMRERRELAMKRRLEEEAQEEAARKERIRLKLEQMGPAPESNSAKRAAAKDQSTPTAQHGEQVPASPLSASADDKTSATANVELGDDTDAVIERTSHAQAQSLAPKSPIDSRTQPQGSSHAHPWPSTAAKQADRFAPSTWGSQPSTKNVWGSPNNDRSLGNGTFNSDLVSSQISQMSSKSGPGPIAPPGSGRDGTAGSVNSRPPPIGPPRQAQRQEHVPGGSLAMSDRNARQSAWAASVQNGDDAFRKMLSEQNEERNRRLENEGRTVADIQPAIKDTWRPTKIDETGRRVEEATKQSLQRGQPNTWAAQSDGRAAGQPSQLSSGAPPSASNMLHSNSASAASQSARGSRFFPSRDSHQDTAHPTEARRHNSPSPPPPDMAGHPAFDGDVSHPHVSLPRPQPVVRLPPAPEAASNPLGPTKPQASGFGWANPSTFKETDSSLPPPSAPFASPRGPVHSQENSWQTRIDNLLGGRKSHLPQKPSTVDSASRSALDHSQQSSAAMVSFPGSSFYNLSSENDGAPTTKGMAEECFEEQEMGSLPPIRLPKKIPDMAWQPSPAPKPLPKKLLATISSVEPITFGPDITGSGTVLRVYVPGMPETKLITVPFGRTRSNPRRSGRGGSGRQGSQPHRGKGRDTSGSYPNEQGSATGSNRAPSRNGRGGGGGAYRGRDNWSRNVSTPIQT